MQKECPWYMDTPEQYDPLLFCLLRVEKEGRRAE